MKKIKCLARIVLIIAIICIIGGLFTGCDSGLSGKYYPAGGGAYGFSCIEFSGGNKVILSESSITYGGTYERNGNTIHITYKMFGSDAIDTYTISNDLKTLTGEGHIYMKI